MKNLNTIAEELFNKIRGRFPSVTIGNEKGEVTNVPTEARFFDFDYKEGNTSLGRISISLDENSVSVMYSDNIVANEDSFIKNKWYDFLKELRVFAKKRLLTFDTRNITKSNLNKRDYKFLATNRPGELEMNESKLYGTSKISYQDVDSARIAIRHNKPVNPEIPTGRTQHIDSIYVESSEGERFKYPYKHLNGARAMARHVSEGGKPFDEFGQHITGLSEELAKLRKFKNYMGRSSVMAESLAGYMDVVVGRIDTVKETINKLQKSNYYKEAVSSFETPVFEDVPEDVKENWIDELTIKQFNEELSDVFPYIYKLVSEATRAKELGPEDLLGEGMDPEEFKQKVADSGDAGYDMLEKALKGEYGDKVQQELEDMYNDVAVDNRLHPDDDSEVILDRMIDNIENDYGDDYAANQDDMDDFDYRQEYNDDSMDDMFERALDEMMGQFAEGDKMARVPLDAPMTTYIVQKGDTLYSLAKKIGTSVDMLKRLNRMDDDNIQVGQKLNIPESMNEEYGPEDDEFHKGIHVALGGDPDDWKPHRDRPVNGNHVELKVPERYKKVSDVIGKYFAKITKIDTSNIDIDYTTGQRSVMIDGETPHPSILSALNGTLDKLDTGEIPGLYKDGNKFSGELEKAMKKGSRKFMKAMSFGPQTDSPKDMQAGISKMSDKELLDLMRGDDAEAPSGSARSLQQKLLKREIKRRGIGESGDMGEGKKIPVTEFVLSFFDRETGQFPRGETAVLTKVEKEYGEQYITPAKQFIEAINNKMAEMYGYKDNDLEEGPITAKIASKMTSTDTGKKIAKAIDNRPTKGLSAQNIAKKVQSMFGKDDEDEESKESTELDRIKGLAGL